MPELDPDVRVVKLLDGDFEPEGLAPDGRVRVVQHGRLQTSFRRNTGGRDDAVVDGVAVAVDHRDGHLDVPRRCLPAALERSLLDRQVEVVPVDNQDQDQDQVIFAISWPGLKIVMGFEFEELSLDPTRADLFSSFLGKLLRTG